MRDALRAVAARDGVPHHVGLAYDAWAPVEDGGRLPASSGAGRDAWLGKLAGIEVAADYVRAFERWQASFTRTGDRVWDLALASRLLVGHGNGSATDVGLTVHHTWGVPLVPGSALKGLAAHYVDAVYGPDDPDLPPWDQADEDGRLRARYQAATWDDAGRRLLRGPGDVHRQVFGAPDTEGDGESREHDLAAGACAGEVVFHDALYVPASAAPDRPFAVDVLTVHQKGYYGTAGRDWPNDHDDPNPVGFLTVRPGARLMFALSGPDEWTALAQRLLTEALQHWGVGGKTSSGYGRFVPPGESGAAPAGTAGGSPGAVTGPSGVATIGALRATPTGPSHAAAAGPSPAVMAGRSPAATAGPPRAATTVPPPGSRAGATPRYRRGDRITVTRVEDPAGKGKAKFRAGDGFIGHFAAEDPPVGAVGDTSEVWVANVSPQGYTLTLRPPKGARR